MSKNLPAGVALRPGGGKRKAGAARRAAKDRVGGGEQPLTGLANRNEKVRPAFREKPPPKEVDPIFCLKFNISIKNSGSWRP